MKLLERITEEGAWRQAELGGRHNVGDYGRMYSKVG